MDIAQIRRIVSSVTALVVIVAIVGSYLIGAIPFGLLIASKWAGVDVRAAGSGNIGATNVARTAGKGLGLATLGIDVLKGATPVLVADYALGLPIGIVAVVGYAAVLGHVFPVYLKFRGGKGVATALGVFVAITPAATGVAGVVFLGVFALLRVVSAGSLAAAVTLVVAVYLVDGRSAILILAVSIGLLIIVRHAENITRLVRGAEQKL